MRTEKYLTASKKVVAPLFIDETLWVTGQDVADILNTTFANITIHAKTLQGAGLFDEECLTLTIPVTRKEGDRSVTRKIKHYSPKAVYLIAMRSNSPQAYEFQLWAADVIYRLNRDGVVVSTPHRESAAAKPKPAQLISNEELHQLECEIGEIARRVEKKKPSYRKPKDYDALKGQVYLSHQILDEMGIEKNKNLAMRLVLFKSQCFSPSLGVFQSLTGS